MGDLMDDSSLIGDKKMVIEMISNQIPKVIRDQYDRPSNVHGKMGPKTKLSKKKFSKFNTSCCLALAQANCMTNTEVY